VAVLTTEDGAFLHHHGFNHAAIRNSLVANLKARKFLRGASTITMQLVKNLFLTREKTLARKLEEVILTDYLEQIFRKEDMMELYLNIIEFGPNIYGVRAAADHYFGRKPEELNLAECLFLSSIMPSPLRFHKIYEKGEISETWLKHVRQLMEIAARTGKISKAELADGLTQSIVFHKPDAPMPVPRPPVGGTHLTGEDEAEWQEMN
jgi:membrane peptidoglycan carboxypeptidase